MKKFLKLLTVLLIFSSGSITKFLSLNNSFASVETNINLDYLDFNPNFNYILGAGDLINISIIEEDPELNLKSFIDQNGTIYLPEINRVFVEGLTINELELLLDKKYESFLKERNLKISLIQNRDIEVYLKGEVERPGMYYFQSFVPLENQNYPVLKDQPPQKTVGNIKFDNKEYMPNQFLSYVPTLFDVIKKSGGITRHSDLQNIEVVRINSISNGGGKIKTNLNLLSVFKDGDTSQNIKLQDNDVITIRRTSKNIDKQIINAMRSNLNPRFINVYLTGRVNRPGPLKVKKNSDLNTVILAGGSKFLKGAITLNRYELDGEISKTKIKYNRNARVGSRNNPYINEGDIINVGEAPFALTTSIINEITSPFVGIYSTIKVLNLD